MSTALLGDIVRLLNDTEARGTVPVRDATNLNFHPHKSDVIINQMWFLSMTLSLSAVVIGTLCLQWLSAFRRKELKQRAFNDALALRQLRFEGLMGWGVPQVPAFLLLTVQGSLVLFATGLVYMLWSVDDQVAIPVVVVGGLAACFLTVTAVMPVLQSVVGWIFPSTLKVPQCPYKSPVAWILHRGSLLLAIIITLPFYLLPCLGMMRSLPPCLSSWHKKLSDWRRDQIGILKDYKWQTFDDLWRRQRERWGPQQSKTKSKYSYYLVNGLASAMERLVFQPNAVHIIHTCLQDFYGTSAEEETFEHLFGKNTTVAKQVLAEYSTIKEILCEKLKQGFHSPHQENLRRDFLNAHALQHLVCHNPKLHYALLPHRVELYTRIKNSSRHLDPIVKEEAKDPTGTGKKRVGTSVECPIQCVGDAEALSLGKSLFSFHPLYNLMYVCRIELRYQFLKFADWFFDTDMHEESDIQNVQHVLDVVKKMEVVSGADDDDESSLDDRLRRVLKLLEMHLMEKPRLSRGSSTATAADFGSGEIGGAPFCCGSGDQGCGNSGSGCSDDRSDRGMSSSVSLSALKDLHASVQRKVSLRRKFSMTQPILHRCQSLV